MMKKITMFIALSCAFALSGCIGTAGQYRGAANGVEIRTQVDGTRIVNVSGDASATVDKNGSVTAVSKSNVNGVVELGKLLTP